MPSTAAHSPPAARYSTVNVPFTCASHSQVRRADVDVMRLSSTARFVGGTTSTRTHSAAVLLTTLLVPPSLTESTMQRTCVPRSSSSAFSVSSDPAAPATVVHALLPRGAVCHV